jgi:hypothetical protein
MRSFPEGTVDDDSGTQGPKVRMKEIRGRNRQMEDKKMAIQEDQDEDIWSTNYSLYTVTR